MRERRWIIIPVAPGRGPVLLRLLAALPLLLAAGGASAQERLTLEECVRLALERNPTFLQSSEAVREMEALSRERRSALLPQLGLTGSFLRQSEVPEFTVPFGPDPRAVRIGDVETKELGLSLSYPLFDGLSLRNRYRVSRDLVAASRQDHAGERSALIFRVKETYFEWVQAEELREVARSSLDQMRAHLKDVQARHDQGTLLRNEVLKVEVKVSEAELRAVKAENAVEIARLGLLSLLGLETTSAVEVDREVEVDSLPWDLERSLAEARSRRPEIAALDSRIRSLEHQVSAEQGPWLPALYLSGNYSRGRPGLNRVLNEWQWFWTTGLVLDWDLWDWGKRHGRIEQARSEVRQMEHRRAQAESDVTLDVTRSYLQAVEARDLLRIARKGVEQATENLRVVEDLFREGMVTNTDYLDALREQVRARAEEVAARAGYRIALADWERATGQSAE